MGCPREKMLQYWWQLKTETTETGVKSHIPFYWKSCIQNTVPEIPMFTIFPVSLRLGHLLIFLCFKFKKCLILQFLFRLSCSILQTANGCNSTLGLPRRLRAWWLGARATGSVTSPLTACPTQTTRSTGISTRTPITSIAKRSGGTWTKPQREDTTWTTLSRHATSGK